MLDPYLVQEIEQQRADQRKARHGHPFLVPPDPHPPLALARVAPSERAAEGMTGSGEIGADLRIEVGAILGGRDCFL